MAADANDKPFQVALDGTISVPAFDLPLSAALSPEAAASAAAAMQRIGMVAPLNADGLATEAEFKAAVHAFRSGLDEVFAVPLGEGLLKAFPVTVEAGRLGGVPVETFTPKDGHDETCVLINLHGGAYYSGAVTLGRVESIPLAHLGRFKVVSVDYRQGYEHKYPAASEDVAAVYRELLKTYPAERIAIYGGSAGGSLTLQATAWILNEGLPAPGAIGVFGAGASGSGDGSYFGAIGTAQRPPIDVFAEIRATRFGYHSETRPDDPLVDPNAGDLAFRAKFPPTLLITATRAFDLSPAIATHRALCQAGVDAQLHVFDGHGHCFYYNAFLPEAADAYQTMIRFFRQKLGG